MCIEMEVFVTCFSVKNIVQRTKWHELTDEHKIRGLVARPKNRKHIRMVKDPEDEIKDYVIIND